MYRLVHHQCSSAFGRRVILGKIAKKSIGKPLENVEIGAILRFGIWNKEINSKVVTCAYDTKEEKTLVTSFERFDHVVIDDLWDIDTGLKVRRLTAVEI